ncbi:MAG: immune inhibitor A domain-containing protein, partial [Candidatus Edwardsbacteria bacterium]
MKRILILLGAIGLTVLFASQGWAVPAYPRPKMLKQPDGTQFMGVLKGDEHFGFAEDENGYSLVHNSEGYWVYAKSEKGLLVPTQYVVGKIDPRAVLPGLGIKRHLRPEAEAVARLPKNIGKEINVTPEQRQKIFDLQRQKAGDPKAPAPAIGALYRAIVLLGNFTDLTFGHDGIPWPVGCHDAPYPSGVGADTGLIAKFYPRIYYKCFGDSTPPFRTSTDSSGNVAGDSTAPGNMFNYYWEASYAQTRVRGLVDTVRSAGVTHDASGDEGTGTTTYGDNTISAANPRINFALFDGNGLVIVHPGYGEEESGNTNDIWSFSQSISKTLDGKSYTKWCFVPENFQPGVICHEFFHNMGAPDMYDYGYSGTPVGDWCLMDAGSWHGDPGGSRPSHMCAVLKMKVDGKLNGANDGWITTKGVNWDSCGNNCSFTVTSTCSLPGSTLPAPRVWKVRNKAMIDSQQVFLVQNRQKVGYYESALPRSGILIAHYDERMNDGTRYNNGPPTTKYYAYWIETPQFNPNPRYTSGDSFFDRRMDDAAYAADYYSPVTGLSQTTFDSLSIPNCKTNKDNAYGPDIYNISFSGHTMQFSVKRLATACPNPVVGYVGSRVADPQVAGTNNNNNQLLNAWETDSLIIRVRNTGAAITAGAACSLYTADPYVTIINPG